MSMYQTQPTKEATFADLGFQLSDGQTINLSSDNRFECRISQGEEEDVFVISFGDRWYSNVNYQQAMYFIGAHEHFTNDLLHIFDNVKPTKAEDAIAVARDAIKNAFEVCSTKENVQALCSVLWSSLSGDLGTVPCPYAELKQAILREQASAEKESLKAGPPVTTSWEKAQGDNDSTIVDKAYADSQLKNAHKNLDGTWNNLPPLVITSVNHVGNSANEHWDKMCRDAINKEMPVELLPEELIARRVKEAEEYLATCDKVFNSAPYCTAHGKAATVGKLDDLLPVLKNKEKFKPVHLMDHPPLTSARAAQGLPKKPMSSYEDKLASQKTVSLAAGEKHIPFGSDTLAKRDELFADTPTNLERRTAPVKVEPPPVPVLPKEEPNMRARLTWRDSHDIVKIPFSYEVHSVEDAFQWCGHVVQKCKGNEAEALDCAYHTLKFTKWHDPVKRIQTQDKLFLMFKAAFDGKQVEPPREVFSLTFEK